MRSTCWLCYCCCVASQQTDIMCFHKKAHLVALLLLLKRGRPCRRIPPARQQRQVGEPVQPAPVLLSSEQPRPFAPLLNLLRQHVFHAQLCAGAALVLHRREPCSGETMSALVLLRAPAQSLWPGLPRSTLTDTSLFGGPSHHQAIARSLPQRCALS